MKKLVGIKLLIAAGLVALLPSMASANVIGWTGDLAIGETDTYGFAVTSAGTFAFNAGGLFKISLFNSAGGSTIGIGVANFFQSLGTGLYTVSIQNVGALTTRPLDYALGIESIRGEVAYAPEPGSLTLLGAGLLGLVALRRRRQTSA